jgi:hypothetical protein
MVRCLTISPRQLRPAVLLFVALSTGFGQSPPSYPHPATDPEHDLTVGEFVKDIGLNFAAIASTHSIVPLAAGAAGTGLATIPEQRLERHFAPGDMWGVWSVPGKYIGSPAIIGSISCVVFGVSRSSDDRKFRSFSYSLIQGAIMSSVSVQSLKVGFGRLRPNGESHRAFPSGHAADSVMFATVLDQHYGWKAGIPAYAVAVYVAATRLEERKHHLTDVAAGAAIGYLIGKTVCRRVRGGKQSRFGWSVYPSRGGFTGTVRVALP